MLPGFSITPSGQCRARLPGQLCKPRRRPRRNRTSHQSRIRLSRRQTWIYPTRRRSQTVPLVEPSALGGRVERARGRADGATHRLLAEDGLWDRRRAGESVRGADAGRGRQLANARRRRDGIPDASHRELTRDRSQKPSVLPQGRERLRLSVTTAVLMSQVGRLRASSGTRGAASSDRPRAPRTSAGRPRPGRRGGGSRPRSSGTARRASVAGGSGAPRGGPSGSCWRSADRRRGRRA